jgi:hypothetical protein
VWLSAATEVEREAKPVPREDGDSPFGARAGCVGVQIGPFQARQTVASTEAMTAAKEQGCAQGECISASSRHGGPMSRDWYLGFGFPDLGSSLFSGLFTSLLRILPTPPQGRLKQLTECDPGFSECPRHQIRGVGARGPGLTWAFVLSAY